MDFQQVFIIDTRPVLFLENGILVMYLMQHQIQAIRYMLILLSCAIQNVGKVSEQITQSSIPLLSINMVIVLMLNIEN